MGWPKGVPHSAEHVKRRVASWRSNVLLAGYRVWTPEMDATLREMHASMSFPTLRRHGPRQLGVSDGKLLERLKVLGLNAAAKKAATLAELRILVAIEPPLCWEDIADRLRLTQITVRGYAKQAGLTKPPARADQREPGTPAS